MDVEKQTLLFENLNKAPLSEKTTEKLQLENRPIAIRMRPKTLTSIVGQDHILGENSLLPRLIQNNNIPNILFYGPPGCGKTTIAQAIANQSKNRFISINAVLSNVTEIRNILRSARNQPHIQTILFIDEIHRFNKAQQDLLLPDVEQGIIRLIGATTHNPSLYIIPPLLSRSHLFRLNPISEEDIVKILKQALIDSKYGLGANKCTATEQVLHKLSQLCNGDLRRALNSLEAIVLSLPARTPLTENEIQTFSRERQIRYDFNEDEHYDTTSAFIKSMRGGDPDAALYWMAKMLAGGEDPRFIARRLVIFASEDVGLADSRALPLAVATFQACEQVGQPECELNLAHATVFLASAPKSNSTTLALAKAKKTIKESPIQSIPLWLRDSHTKVGKILGHGKHYRYSHNYPQAISGQEYLQKPLHLYHPKPIEEELQIAQRLKQWQTLKKTIQQQK
jgi:putative ATPase